MGGIFEGLFGSPSSGPSAEEIKAEEEKKRRQTLAGVQARARSRSSRRGVQSLTTTPTSTGLNIPGGDL